MDSLIKNIPMSLHLNGCFIIIAIMFKT